MTEREHISLTIGKRMETAYAMEPGCSGGSYLENARMVPKCPSKRLES